MLSNIRGVYPKKAPIGVYDKGILCRECEDKFEIWDNYGIKILLKEFAKFDKVAEPGEVIAYFTRKYDYALLKLFFISILWRASVSGHPYYSKVNLGVYEHIAKEMLEVSDPGGENEFSTLVSIFVSSKARDRLAKTMLDPYMERWEGVNAYRFYLAGFCAYIKVDKRKLPISLRNMLMRNNRELYVVTRNLEKSNDVKAMVAVVMGARH